MKCSNCQSKTKVLDSREMNEGLNIKRRRSCLNCKQIFFTQEILFQEDKPKVEPKEIKDSRTQKAVGHSDMNDIWADLTDSNFTLRELGIKK
tara:strand:- start:484 stop:759 length:276 start_codon:yes stop_codon:yes gene_type:complete